MIKVQDNTIIVENAVATLEDKENFQSAFVRLINEGHNEILVDLVKASHLPTELIGYLLDRKRDQEKTGLVMKIISVSESLKKLFERENISEFLDL